MLYCIEISVVVAVVSSIIGYTYSEVLIRPGEVFSWLYRIFYRILTKQVRIPKNVPEELKGSVPEYQEVTVEHWLLKPLGQCAKCTSGQISFWLFLYLSIQQSLYVNNDCIFVSSIHIFTVCLTILITLQLKKLS